MHLIVCIIRLGELTGDRVRELAGMAKISTNSITWIERAKPLKERTVDAIRAALESSGVDFTNGDQPGVSLKKG